MRTSVLFLALLSGTAFAGHKKSNQDQGATPPAAPSADTTQAAPVPPPEETAAPGPADVVKLRQAEMDATGKHMKVSMMLAKGRVAATPQDLQAQAAGLHSTALNLAGLFPQGTGPDAVPDTKALAQVWSDPTGFQDRINQYANATSTLVDVAATGDLDAWKAQLKQVGQACGGCHDGYRQDED